VAGVNAGYAPRLSYELEGIRTRGEFLRAAAECVGALLPADQHYWTAVDTGEGAAEMYGTGGMGRPEIVQALGRWVGAHPLLLSYRDRPGDMAPLRLSDMIAVRAWRSHPVYAEVYRPLGAVHQICAAVIPYRDGAGAGWGFNRTGRDFTDDELELLARLQPVLIALNQASTRAFGASASGPGTAAASRDEAAAKAALTPREVRVLELLAAGLTATAIGHVCRISPRTVRKHLENIYAKLGCHDRLVAVRRAAELGLV
jgi:DNA-binding CsgD family transcriptional regulator